MPIVLSIVLKGALARLASTYNLQSAGSKEQGAGARIERKSKDRTFARLASEVFLSSLQAEFFSKVLKEKWICFLERKMNSSRG